MMCSLSLFYFTLSYYYLIICYMLKCLLLTVPKYFHQRLLFHTEFSLSSQCVPEVYANFLASIRQPCSLGQRNSSCARTWSLRYVTKLQPGKISNIIYYCFGIRDMITLQTSGHSFRRNWGTPVRTSGSSRSPARVMTYCSPML
jgi:hypothetical protein